MHQVLMGVKQNIPQYHCSWCGLFLGMLWNQKSKEEIQIESSEKQQVKVDENLTMKRFKIQKS